MFTATVVVIKRPSHCVQKKIKVTFQFIRADSGPSRLLTGSGCGSAALTGTMRDLEGLANLASSVSRTVFTPSRRHSPLSRDQHIQL